MVPDSGKTLRSSAYKPVNLPEPLQVSESTSGEPVAVKVAQASSPGKMSPSVAQASPPVKMSPSVAQASPPVKKPPSVAQASLPVKMPVGLSFWRRAQPDEESGGEAVTSIDDRWRIDDEWWRSEPVSRLYYAVLFASGQRLVIYKDLISGKWYKQVY